MARVLKFPQQISSLVSQDHYDRIKTIETAHPVSLGDVIRDIIAAGLPSVEAKYAALESATDSHAS